MSWEEYNDMFAKAQITGKYHLFIFDIRGSRYGYNPEKIQELIDALYKRLHLVAIEKKLPKILHIPIEEIEGKRRNILGDLFSVVIIRDTLSPNEFYKIFAEEKDKLNLQYKFHFDDGYYETDYWELGDKEYYREYCRSYLEARSKMKKDTI